MFTAAWGNNDRSSGEAKALSELTQLAIGLHPIQENSESVMLTFRVYPTASNTTDDETTVSPATSKMRRGKRR